MLVHIAGRDWVAISETSARTGLTCRDPLEDNPAAVQDRMGQPVLLSLKMDKISKLEQKITRNNY